MSLKLFCDLCDEEIPIDERHYNVNLDVKRQEHGDDALENWYGDFCYRCTKSGDALRHLMKQYETAQARRKAERDAATLGVPQEPKGARIENA